MLPRKRRGIIDLSSVIWTCLLASKDTEFGREVVHDGKKYQVNSASYGFENSVNHVMRFMESQSLVPIDLIFVMEGQNSKAERQSIYQPYKSNRDKCPEQYEEFNKCKEQLIELFLNLGSMLVWQDGGVEADDVMGYLALHLQGERIIDSGDKDLAVLVNPEKGIHHYRRGILDQNPCGLVPFPHQYIPVYFALVGDTNDKIPGCRGFGDKAFEKLYMTFGDEGLEMMQQLIQKRELKRLQEDVHELKELQKIIDDAPGVYTSYELARLRLEKVNTLRRPLSFKPGMVKPREQIQHDQLRKYGGVIKLVCAENYDEAYAWAQRELRRSSEVSLDIETSSPEESDAWLEAAGRSDGIDIFGAELTSVQLTFGLNGNLTVYLPVDNVEEPDVHNLSKQQVRDLLALIPETTVVYIHNTQFELPVLLNTLGPLGTPTQEQKAWAARQRM